MVGVPASLVGTAAGSYLFQGWAADTDRVSFSDYTSSGSYATILADINASTANVTGYFGTATPSNVNLSMAVSPSGSGTLTPSAWTTTAIRKGVPYWMTATAITGYKFLGWSSSDPSNTVIDNPSTAATRVTLSANCTITASFVTAATTIITHTLSLDVATAATGTVKTPDGSLSKTVNNAVATYIIATPADGYSFAGWTAVSDKVSIHNSSAATTTATITNTTSTPATVTAHFSYVAPTTYALTMASSPTAGGTTSPSATVIKNVAYWISATPATGYNFQGWAANDSTKATIASISSASTSVTLTGTATVTAYFATSAAASVNMTMAISPADKGGTTPIAGTTTSVQKGVPYWITATAVYGYYFQGWASSNTDTLFTSSTADITTVIINTATATTITAYFDSKVKASVTLTLAASPTDGGATTPASSATIQRGVPYWVNATPASGYNFLGWSPSSATNVSIADPNVDETTVTLQASAKVTAYFQTTAISTATFALAVNPTGTGSVTSSITGTTARKNLPFWLTATAITGYQFKGWSADSTNATIQSPNSSSSLVTLTGDATITANFSTTAQTTATLTINNSPSVGGTTTPAAGAQTVSTGVSVAIKANAATGYNFSGWALIPAANGNVGSYISAETTVTLTGDATLVACFSTTAPAAVNLTMAASPSAGGSTAPKSSASVYVNQVVGISAIAASGYTFQGWAANPSTNATITDKSKANTTVSLSAVATLTAYFAQAEQESISLTMALNNASGGATTPIGTSTVLKNVPVTITATAAAGYNFFGWSGTPLSSVTFGDATSASTTATLSASAIVTAYFYTAAPGNVALTMASNSTTYGSTTPASNSQTSISKGVPYQIAAVPATSYYFLGWGSSSKDNVSFASQEATTTVNLLDNATVTAYFGSYAQALVDLTMAVSPDNSGTTSPAVGVTSIQKGVPYWITATAAAGYNFMGWSPSTSTTTLASNTTATTTVTLTESTTLTAYFQTAAVTSAQLVMAASPTAGGTVTPASGSIPKNLPFWITATPSTGYLFQGWASSAADKATISAPLYASTLVTITDDVALTAYFSTSTQTTSILTMASSPTAGGSTLPASGQTTVANSVPMAVKATPASGYNFTGWTAATGSKAILSSLILPSTTITVNQATKLTANFSAIAPTAATLTMAANSASLGAVCPVAGSWAVYTGQTVAISATPTDANLFLRWEAIPTGNVTFGSSTTANTTAVLSGDATITAYFAASPLTLTFVAGTGGTLSGTTPQSVVYNNSASAVTATAKTGYDFVNWTGTGGFTTTTSNPLTVTNVTASMTITANFVVKTFAVAFVAGSNGTVSPSGTQTVSYGASTAAVTATPNTSCFFVNWTGTGGFVTTTTNPLTVTNVTAGMTITANFLPVYTLNYVAGTGGTLSGTTTQAVIQGSSATAVTAIANTGYTFVNWTGTSGFTTTTTNPLTVTNVTASMTITANFLINSYTLTFVSGSNGSISPSAVQTVNYGSSSSAVTATPNSGYTFLNWTGTSGFSTSTANPLTVTNVTASMTITANFAPTISLTFAAGANGTISPSGTQSVAQGGSSAAVTATPNASYKFVNWTGTNGFTTSTANPLTVTNVTSAMTITANFSIITYTVTFAAGSNGAITPDGAQTVNIGSSATAVTAKPTTGYSFVNWTGTNGFTTSTANPLTVTNVTSDMTITANFSINSYTVTFVAGDNGTVKPSGAQTVKFGSSASAVTATANANYEFVNWTGTNGFSTSTVNPLTVNNVTANMTITANFKGAPLTLTMAVSPASAGSTTPTGSTSANYGDQITITATTPEGSGFEFETWTVDTGASLDDPSSASTKATLYANATVTAVFKLKVGAVSLTMAASPSDAGATTPEAGVMTPIMPDTPYAITATAATGYTFLQWTALGDNATFDDEYAATTTVMISGDETVTANFMASGSDYFTYNSVRTIKASEVSGLPSTFSSKPPVYVQYDPYTNKPIYMSVYKFAKGATSVQTIFNKKILLYQKSDYNGKLISEVLTNGRMNDCRFDGLYISTSETGARPVSRSCYLAAPYMISVTGDMAAGGTLVIEGMYFGTKAPKISVETITSAGKPSYKACKIVNSSLIFKDIANKPSCMKVIGDTNIEQPVGYSVLSVVYPKIPSSSEVTGKLLLDNGIGLAIY